MHFRLGRRIIDKIRGKKNRKIIPICDDYGINNKFLLIDGKNKEYQKKINGLKVIFFGNNNTVFIKGDSYFLHDYFKDCVITCYGSNSFIEINDCNRDITKGEGISNLNIWVNKGACVKIGTGFSCGGCEIIADNFGADIEIGNDNMFSNEICIRSTDGHTIIKNGKKINPGEKIEIQNHVWLGKRSTVLKGAKIPDNSIVGYGSIVLSKKKYPSLERGSLFVGSPAKIVSVGLNWSRDNFDDFYGLEIS